MLATGERNGGTPFGMEEKKREWQETQITWDMRLLGSWLTLRIVTSSVPVATCMTSLCRGREYKNRYKNTRAKDGIACLDSTLSIYRHLSVVCRAY